MQPILEDEPAADAAGITRRKLLIPVDDSTESERALQWAMEEMYRLGSCKVNRMFDTQLTIQTCFCSYLQARTASHELHRLNLKVLAEIYNLLQLYDFKQAWQALGAMPCP